MGRERLALVRRCISWLVESIRP